MSPCTHWIRLNPIRDERAMLRQIYLCFLARPSPRSRPPCGATSRGIVPRRANPLQPQLGRQHVSVSGRPEDVFPNISPRSRRRRSGSVRRCSNPSKVPQHHAPRQSATITQMRSPGWDSERAGCLAQRHHDLANAASQGGGIGLLPMALPNGPPSLRKSTTPFRVWATSPRCDASCVSAWASPDGAPCSSTGGFLLSSWLTGILRGEALVASLATVRAPTTKRLPCVLNHLSELFAVCEEDGSAG